MHGKGQPWPKRSSYVWQGPRSRPSFGEIDLSVIEVVTGIAPDQFKARITQNPPNLTRNTCHKRTRRNNSPLRNDRSSRNNRPRPNPRPIQNNRPNSNEHIVLQNAPMNSGIMTNRDPIANENGIHIALAMNNSAILHIRAHANANVMHIPPNNSVHPDAGTLTENNIPKHLGRGIDIGSWRNRRIMAKVRTKHGIEFIGIKRRKTTSRGKKLPKAYIFLLERAEAVYP